MLKSFVRYESQENISFERDLDDDNEMRLLKQKQKQKQKQPVLRSQNGLWAWPGKAGLLKRESMSVRICYASFLILLFLFVLDWWLLSGLRDTPSAPLSTSDIPNWLKGEWSRFGKDKRLPGIMYDRLLGLAAHALAESELKSEPSDLWEEPYKDASAWKPCSNQQAPGHQLPPGPNNMTGYIMVSANGGLNQQRVAICNAVAVSSLLNATLVLPRFLYSNVWKDNSRFADIYQEKYFIDYLKDDVRIVKDLPLEFQSLNLQTIGSVITDTDVSKEAKPSFYVRKILPILLRNRVVHFYGFGNRLSFDPIPFALQRLRCKCNFHALKFSSKIQKIGAVLVDRIRENADRWALLEEQLAFDSAPGEGYSTAELSYLRTLVGNENLEGVRRGLPKGQKNARKAVAKYLGLHLRFEIDMAAYSTCDFGGDESEKQELEMYREAHFPTLTMYKNNGKLLSAAQLRLEGKCPLTPEEAVLMLVALGFKRGTRIFVAGADIYGGKSRMIALSTLYPNLVTKHDLLSPQELALFTNSSSQLAALDFIGCTAANAFAMTDPGSQLSSLVSGYRIYYGYGQMPTIRPNKRRLASIFSKNMTLEWDEFRDRIRKAVKESKRVLLRPVARSIYRHPRCPECMCKE